MCDATKSFISALLLLPFAALLLLPTAPLLLLPVAAQAQTPDTTSAWRYHPLAVRNVWQFRSHGMTGGGQRCNFISADTLVNGTRYFVESTLIVRHDGRFHESESLVRFDTASATLRFLDVNGEERILYPGRVPHA